MAYGLVSADKTMTILKRYYDVIAIILLFSCVWILRIIDLPTYPLPLPAIHDEFANYLGAETFALGRLTNPPHEFSNDSLAEIHVLPEPSRMMKYQPAMAGFMALGIALFGHAHWGVVLLTALAIAASYWSMRGWSGKITSTYIALLLLFMLRVPHYFIDSYWGGAHVILGSFLIIGSYPRIVGKKQYGYIWAYLLGASVLLLSRPYEGLILILSFFICAVFTIWKKFSAEETLKILRKTSLPIILIGIITLAFQLYYNKAITGSYTTLPYSLYQEQRDHSPSFFFLPQNDNNISEHYAIRSVQEAEDEYYNASRITQIQRFFPEALIGLTGRYDVQIINRFTTAFIVAMFLSIMVILYNSIKNKKHVVLSLNLITQATGYMLLTWLFASHYLTIFFALLITIIAINIAQFYVGATGKFLYLGIISGFMAIFIFYPPTKFVDKYKNQSELRQSIETTLGNDKEKHLVLVDQLIEAREKILHYSFVHNKPDIDQAKIVWAWYLSPEQNKKLIDYYHDRKVWYIEPYKEKLLIPYNEK